MRRFVSLFLIGILTAGVCLRASAAAKAIQESQGSVTPLTTKNILELIRTGTAAGSIIAQLERSGCTCDISPDELKRLKSEGVPDEILISMISTSSAIRQVEKVITIPHGTVVEIETAYRISSQEVRAGEAITFRVINPVKVGDVIVIEAGSVATGRIIKASRGGHFGRAGRLAWTMETVTAIDGSRIPIQAAGRVVGDSKGAKVATSMAITGALLGPFAPAALLFGFKRGENAYLAQGRRYDVIVLNDTTIRANYVRQSTSGPN